MSDIAEGGCTIQCWICPKCHDDHSQDRECKKIDTWEAEAKKIIGEIWTCCDASGLDMVSNKNQRILSLIDLVRKKDFELTNAMALIHTDLCSKNFKCHKVCNRIDKAVALTKELK